MGRPSKALEWLTEDNLLIIKGWARDGLTKKEIAHNIGVRAETLSVWQRDYPQFSQAIKEGSAPVLVKLEDSMLSRCEWRQVEETEEVMWQHPDGSVTKKITRKKKWLPPDTAMTIFMAKNKMPNKYRDNPEPIAIEQREDSGLIAALMANPDEDLCDDTEMITDED